MQFHDCCRITDIAPKNMEAGQRSLRRIEIFLAAAGNDDCVAAQHQLPGQLEANAACFM